MFRFEAANPKTVPSPPPTNGGGTPALAAFRQLKVGKNIVPYFVHGDGAGEPALNSHLFSLPVVQEVAGLYSDLHDTLENGTNHPGWQRGVYPTPGVAAIAYEKGTLYLLRDGDALVGTVVLNQEPEDAYAKASWGRRLSANKVLIVHTLAVHPAHQGRGVARALLAHAEQLAKERGLAAVRLDTWENNAPGKALYEKCGYTFRGVADFGLSGLGLNRFHLYEKIL